MPSRKAPVSPMGEVQIGGAGRALRSRVDLIPRDSRRHEGRRDRLGQVERGLAGGVTAEKPRVELRRDLGPDREAAGVEAGPDRGANRVPLRPGLGQKIDRMGRDLGAGATPPAVEEGAAREVFRHDRYRRAVRGGDGDPRITHADQEPIGLAGRGARLHDAGSVNLMEPQRTIALDAHRGAEAEAILDHRALLVADTQAHVERRVRSHAHAAAAGGEGEAGAVGKRPRRGIPQLDWLGTLRGRLHRETMARLAGAAQAICALLLAAGCAHAPAPSNGAEARARFLAGFARADTATRGAGMLAVRQGGKGREGLNTRWAAVRESLAVVAYAGPIRALDAIILGDSVYLAIRPYELGIAGQVRTNGGLGARGLVFLARPWAFGASWVREAVERAAVEPNHEGWGLTGALGADGSQPFTLTLNTKGEPRLLRIQLSSDARDVISIRYGPVRRFSSVPIPRWVEWTRGSSQIRLDIEDHAPAKPSQLRRSPPAREDWTIVALDDPRGRNLLRRFFGVGDEETAP